MVSCDAPRTMVRIPSEITARDIVRFVGGNHVRAWLRHFRVRLWLECTAIIALVTACILAMKVFDWLFGPWWTFVGAVGLFAIALWLWTHPR